MAKFIESGIMGNSWSNTLEKYWKQPQIPGRSAVHEPIKDTGLRRTFPNMLSREGAKGQESMDSCHLKITINPIIRPFFHTLDCFRAQWIIS